MRPILPRVLLRSTPSSLLTSPLRRPTIFHPPRAIQPNNVRFNSSLGFSARMKQLSKEYGYAALGVYFGLSALDFPFCFLFVKWVGTERVGEWEEKIVGKVKPHWVGFREKIGFPLQMEDEETLLAEKREREEQMKGASIWTELALAYAIHKSFIFIRVPLTAAVTPKVVKVLKRWGWDLSRKGGPRRVKSTSGGSKE